jgi:putative DNA primase/helicase
LQIADLLGGEWPLRARTALNNIFDLPDDATYVAPLLSDIQNIFGAEDTGDDQRIPTADLLGYLNNLDTRPWRSWNKGGPMTARNLTRLLGHAGIRSRNQRYSSGGRGKGYQYEDFVLPWENWIPNAEKRALEVPGKNDEY